MSEVNNPRGIGLSEAQTAISSLLSPDEDNEATEALDEVDEEEYSEDAETEQADDDEDDSSEEDADLDEDEESDDDEDQSLDILSAKVEVDGVEMTVEEVKAGYLRQRDYTRKTQEISESRKQLEAFNAELNRERAQYEQLLPMLEQQLQENAQPEPDWDTLYDLDPRKAARDERKWKQQQEQRIQQLQAVDMEKQRMGQIRAQFVEEAKAKYLEAQKQVLPEFIPEWRDDKVAQREASQVRDFLISEGFSEDDVAGVTSASLVRMARMAMLYAKGSKRADEVKAKPKKPQGKMLKAGSNNTGVRTKSDVQRAQQRFNQTGNVRDAAELLKNFI